MKKYTESDMVAEILRLKAVFDQGQVLLDKMLIAARIAEAEGGTERGLNAIDRAIDYGEELARITAVMS